MTATPSYLLVADFDHTGLPAGSHKNYIIDGTPQNVITLVHPKLQRSRI